MQVRVALSGCWGLPWGKGTMSPYPEETFSSWKSSTRCSGNHAHAATSPCRDLGFSFSILSHYCLHYHFFWADADLSSETQLFMKMSFLHVKVRRLNYTFSLSPALYYCLQLLGWLLSMAERRIWQRHQMRSLSCAVTIQKDTKNETSELPRGSNF